LSSAQCEKRAELVSVSADQHALTINKDSFGHAECLMIDKKKKSTTSNVTTLDG